MGKNYKQVVVRLDKELLRKLKEISERDERTVSQTVRLAVRQYLAAKKKENEMTVEVWPAHFIEVDADCPLCIARTMDGVRPCHICHLIHRDVFPTNEVTNET